MGFRTDSYAKVWKVENKGNYHNVQLSVSKKDKSTDKYIQDFGGFVRFVGTAHKLAESLKEGDKIKIGSCDVSNTYNKEKGITYYNFAVFSYEMADGNNNNKNESSSKSKENQSDDIGNEEELPF